MSPSCNATVSASACSRRAGTFLAASASGGVRAGRVPHVPRRHALQVATTDMVRWLTADYSLEPWAAHQLIGAVGKYDVVTVAGTMALKVPKKYLSK